MSPWRYAEAEGRFNHPKIWRAVTTAAMLLAAAGLVLGGWVFHTIQADRANTREAITRAIIAPCRNLNHKIVQSQEQPESTALLIKYILTDPDLTVAQRKHFIRLSRVEEPPVKRTNCKRIVTRSLP